MLTLRLPEIEVPSCAATLGKSAPELFANKDAKGNITHANILCAGKPGICDTVSAHIDEIIDMFPHASYMHIGGDEAAVDIWKNWWDKVLCLCLIDNSSAYKSSHRAVYFVLGSYTHEQSLHPIKENLAALSERHWNEHAQVDTDAFIKAPRRIFGIVDKIL